MVFVLVAAALAGTMPDYPDLPADLAEAARSFDAAQVHGDRAALEKLLSDDYLLINSSDEQENKADFIRDYTAPGFSFAPFSIERPVHRFWPGGAALGGVVEAKGTSEGKPYSIRLRFVDVWAKREGRWQVVLTQANHVMSGK